MRLILPIFVFLTFSIQSLASLIEVSGPVSGNWNSDTILVTDDLLIPNTLTLNIHSGVLVLFDGHFIINVKGQLMANGLENDSILFKVADTTGFYDLQTNDGGFNGILFENPMPSNDSSILEFCRFENGKAVGSDSSYWYGGAICIRQYDKLRISNCSFSNNIAYKNGGAIYAYFSNLTIEACNFENNRCGLDILYGYGGAVCLEYSEPFVYQNQFSQNQSTGVGGGLSFEYSKPRIVSNYFFNNFSAIGGGMVCLRSSKSNSIVNNLFENNGALFFGGGLAFLETSVLMVNNTIVNNFAGQGGGLYFNFESTPDFKNCIIWGNTSSANDGSQVYIWDIYSAPEFYFCDIQFGLEGFSGSGGTGSGFIGIYEDCIETDPQFNLSGNYPFGLSNNSPCINSGTPDTTGLFLPETDLSGMDRFRGNHLDIGAYESQLETSIFSHLSIEKEIEIYPHPITNQSVISLHLDSDAEIGFSIFDMNGKLVWKNPKSTSVMGMNLIPLKMMKLKSGYYLLKIILANEPNKSISRKIFML